MWLPNRGRSFDRSLGLIHPIFSPFPLPPAGLQVRVEFATSAYLGGRFHPMSVGCSFISECQVISFFLHLGFLREAGHSLMLEAGGDVAGGTKVPAVPSPFQRLRWMH